MEEKKQGKTLVVALVLFILTTLVACGYIVYDKVLTKDNNTKEVNTKKEDTKELDINSRLVQSLYRKVKPAGEEGDCRLGWNYDEHHEFGADDFNASSAKEEIKMRIVSQNLLENEKEEYPCDDSAKNISNINIPGRINECTGKYSDNSIGAEPRSYYKYYNKDYIEAVYKDIFGSDAKLDTSVPLETDGFGIESYYYVNELNQYILYPVEGGGTCGPDGYSEKLLKAEKKNGSIKIYANWIYKHYGKKANDEINYDDEKVTKTRVVYTFKLEDDGAYSFVSRVREK